MISLASRPETFLHPPQIPRGGPDEDEEDEKIKDDSMPCCCFGVDRRRFPMYLIWGLRR